MGAYLINGKNLADYGFIPGHAPESNLAITGVWDMPPRMGKTFHAWPDQNGVEPYLRADELFYGGRDITLYGHLKAASRIDAYKKIQALYDDLDILAGGLFPLSSDWGSWNVHVLQQVQVGYIKNGICKVQLPFREPVVSMAGEIPAATDAPIGIDGISFADLGLVKVLTSDNFNRPASKQAEFTAFGHEGYSVTKRGVRTFNIRFLLRGDDYASFAGKVQGFIALLSSPGARTLRLDDGTVREFFVKDGFTVTGVRKLADRTFGIIDIPMAEIRLLENWNLFTDQNGLILTDGNGRPLTEILKGF